MNEFGKIVGLNGKTAIISLTKTEKCEKCKKCRPGRDENEVIMEARNKAGGKIGDVVEITDNLQSTAGKIFIQTGIPISDGIIGGIIGYILAKSFGQMDKKVIWIMLSAIFCAAASFVLTKRFLVNNNHIQSNVSIVSAIVSSGE